MPKKTPGIYQINGWWHIDKAIKGIGRIRGSCGTKDRAEAEKRLGVEIEKRRRAMIYGERVHHTFEEAAAKYVDEATHKSIIRDITCLKAVMPWIGHLDLLNIHDGTLREYINFRKQTVKSSTVKRDIAVVGIILQLAARKWRDDSGLTWIPQAPLLDTPNWNDKRQAYPLSWTEQRKLLKELPDHLAAAALYSVNTGIRNSTQTELRWEWETYIKELKCSVFVVPATAMKGDDSDENEHVIVHNSIAQGIIESRRGIHPEFVFTYRGHTVGRFANSAWKKARKRAGLPQFRWHDWRHTFARRLRAAGVPKETRKALMGHKDGDITTHYSAVEIQELLIAVQRIEKQTKGTLLRAVR